MIKTGSRLIVNHKHVSGKKYKYDNSGTVENINNRALTFSKFRSENVKVIRKENVLKPRGELNEN